MDKTLQIKLGGEVLPWGLDDVFDFLSGYGRARLCGDSVALQGESRFLFVEPGYMWWSCWVADYRSPPEELTSDLLRVLELYLKGESDG